MSRIATVVPLPGPRTQPVGDCAVVVDAAADLLLVAFGAVRLPARRALSCLLRPETGDRVLIGNAGGELWVLAVLERESAAPLRLVAQGDLEVASIEGRLTLAGAAGVDIATPAAARVVADAFTLHARLAETVINEVRHVGQQIAAHAERLKLVGHALEAVFDRVMTRAKRSYRFVEESDHLRSAEIDHRASETLHLSARNAFVTAEGVVKLDGEQIHMG